MDLFQCLDVSTAIQELEMNEVVLINGVLGNRSGWSFFWRRRETES